MWQTIHPIQTIGPLNYIEPVWEPHYRYINVSAEQINLTPIAFDEISVFMTLLNHGQKRSCFL